MPYTTYGLLKAARSHTLESPSVTASLRYGRPNACNQCHLDKTLAWTADALSNWYGTSKPDLPEQSRTVAASILWSLTGDAAQRAIAAWTMGWTQAKQTCETDWVLPYLAQLMTDDYGAVRFIAYQSLRSRPEFKDFPYDPLGSKTQRKEAAERVYERWRRHAAHKKPSQHAQLLISPKGQLLRKQFDQLLLQRDNRPVFIPE